MEYKERPPFNQTDRNIKPSLKTQAQFGTDEIELHLVDLVWHTFMKVSGIDDLSKVPDLSKPDSNDVKAILFMYSLESFLFKTAKWLQLVRRNPVNGQTGFGFIYPENIYKVSSDIMK